MNTFVRLVFFGTASGLVWGVAPLTLSELWQSSGETTSILLAGALTGVAVTLLLAWPLHRASRWPAIALGVMSLPLGAFLFGVIASWVHYGLAHWLDVTYRFTRHRFDPLQVGEDYALFASLSWFAIALIPLAVATTILLHRAVHGIEDFDWT
jgi:hypothetical protein